MQLARLQAFRAELEAEVGDLERVTGLALIMKALEGWKDDASNDITDARTLMDSERVLRTGRHWKGRHSRKVYFPVQALQVVIIAEFVSVPRRSTQDTFAKKLRKALKRSEDAFDARHDQLTGLRNKRTFDEALVHQLSSANGVMSAVAATVVQPRNGVSILAFDIDHFKQVNDTFGHLYGDIVLQAFATRLSAFVSALEKTLEARASISVARTGGEEFAILLSGDLTNTEVDEIAEKLRQLIANKPMPSDEEWQPLARVNGAEKIELPLLTDRRVTTSIGVATATDLKSREVRQLAADLKQQADLALYRAKSGGRNTIRRFSDILAKYGSIL